MKQSRNPLRGVDIRKQNEKLVLSLIQKNKYISQSEVASLTGLKPPTVLRIFSHLEENNFIKTTKHQKSNQDRKGRKPVYYCVRREAGYAIGLEFWALSATVVVSDFSGTPVFNKTISLNDDHDAENVLRMLGELINQAIAEAGMNKERLLGIGIGAPGRVDLESGTVLYYSRIEGLSHFSLKERLEELFDVPVIVNNNCSVVAYHEYTRGCMQESRSLMVVLIRSGVGGAFINEGRVLVTEGRTTLELGHMSIDFQGRQCECGGQGCLETYLSEKALLEDLGLEGLEDVEEALKQKDPEMVSLVDKKGELLALAVRNVFRLFSPESFLIMTRSESLSEAYARQVKLLMETDSYNRRTHDVKVDYSVYDPIQAGQGAADLVFSRFFGKEM